MLLCEGIVVVLPISLVPEVTPATVVVAGAEVILALVPELVSPDVDCGAVDAPVLVAPSVVSVIGVDPAEEFEAASPVVDSCGAEVDCWVTEVLVTPVVGTCVTVLSCETASLVVTDVEASGVVVLNKSLGDAELEVVKDDVTSGPLVDFVGENVFGEAELEGIAVDAVDTGVAVTESVPVVVTGSVGEDTWLDVEVDVLETVGASVEDVD